MNKQTFLKWLRINSLCYLGAFVLVFLLVQLFPSIMLGFWEGWSSLIKLTGGKRMEELSSEFDAFIHILSRNSVSVGIYFIGGLLLQAPFVTIVLGSFYSLVAFAVPLSTGILQPFSFWILIAIEALFLIIPATFSSTLATEIFGVKPEKKQLLGYWKKSFRDLRYFPKQKGWTVTFKENKKELISFTIIILGLLLFGVWFEVWGC